MIMTPTVVFQCLNVFHNPDAPGGLGKLCVQKQAGIWDLTTWMGNVGLINS